jgi:2-polyprenyl-3-methyl-5-hydroxy-6-metoxy-1,4-benzoquinol methylase
MNEIDQIREELFCVKYETTIFAGYVKYGKIERWVPDFTDSSTEDSHLKRYQFALNYVKDKNVLDIACGTGRGTFLLACDGLAKHVTGVDLENEAIRYAKHRHPYPTVAFEVGDAMKYVKEDYYDTIVSFETIEHITDVKTYLYNLNISLKNDGYFIVSTPISASKIDLKPLNPFHVREWGFSTFHQVLAEYFTIEEIYLQLYPKIVGNDFYSRVKRFIKRTLLNSREEHFPYISTIQKYETNLSEKFIKELGTRRRGYQIVVCRKPTKNT